MKRTKLTLVLLSMMLLTINMALNATPYPPTKPFPPFRIISNVYYVGNNDLASYLIVTSRGNILINSNFETDVPAIKANIEKLGFKFSDTKILLISHAHSDHVSGSALIKKMTDANFLVMDGDVAVVQSGGKTDFQYGNDPDSRFTPTQVDRTLYDGDEVTLGNTTLVAHLTPGHTKGCTTWTMTVTEKGKNYDVVFLGSPNVNPGYKLVNNKAYPQIASDYQQGFNILKSLHCDVFLGAHAGYFDLQKKYAHLNSKTNPFIDPESYKRYINLKEQAFLTELKKQQKKN